MSLKLRFMNQFFAKRRSQQIPQTFYTASTKNKLKEIPDYLEQENTTENI
jgi:hypothetical protein